MSSKKGRKPAYDAERRELRLGEEVVKQFNQPAKDQEVILVAFEELGWPNKLDDPLTPDGVQVPKVRLNNVIKNLNRN